MDVTKIQVGILVTTIFDWKYISKHCSRSEIINYGSRSSNWKSRISDLDPVPYQTSRLWKKSKFLFIWGQKRFQLWLISKVLKLYVRMKNFLTFQNISKRNIHVFGELGIILDLDPWDKIITYPSGSLSGRLVP
jgi:hypothetical protein